MFVVHWLLEYYSYDKIFLHLIVQTMESMYDFAETRIIIYFSKKKILAPDPAPPPFHHWWYISKLNIFYLFNFYHPHRKMRDHLLEQMQPSGRKKVVYCECLS